MVRYFTGVLNLYKIVILAFQRINLKHNLDQLIPQSKVLQSEISDEDSGSHSMDSNPAQGMLKNFNESVFQ